MLLVAEAAMELALSAGVVEFPAESSSKSSGDEGAELALLLQLTTFSMNSLEWLGFSFSSNVDIYAKSNFAQTISPIKIYVIRVGKTDWHILRA